jgi:hypothetical protein
MNEGVIRSPKWLRNFVDFEVNTGDDIKGNPSKSRLRRDQIKKWEDRWSKVDREELRSFTKEKFQIKSLEKVKKKFFADDNFWDLYDEWIDKKRKKKEEQDRLIKELDNLYKKILLDYEAYPYRDKISVENSSFRYRFEDGTIFTLYMDNSNKLNYRGITYRVGDETYISFLAIVSGIAKNCTNRPGQWRSKTNTSKDPNRIKYDKLKDIIKIREDQLNKMDDKDPNKKLLRNELESYKRKVQQMKDQYKFENLRSFENFSLDELENLDIDKKEISNKVDEIKDIFHDLELEIDISVEFNFEESNKFLSTIVIHLNSKDIDDQVSKMKEIGKTISRLDNCMQFYTGKAYGSEYGEVGSFSFDFSFFDDYHSESELEIEDGDPIFIGDLIQLEITFLYV